MFLLQCTSLSYKALHFAKAFKGKKIYFCGVTNIQNKNSRNFITQFFIFQLHNKLRTNPLQKTFLSLLLSFSTRPSTIIFQRLLYFSMKAFSSLKQRRIKIIAENRKSNKIWNRKGERNEVYWMTNRLNKKESFAISVLVKY